uniref:Uncharacterized protein n=1 Tax=Myoviridae sp. ctBtT5 TaxID=2825048 RepID=A0A8S5PY85_9CAUD|nr:MAG TPA: hypothetical protein [Myoviridae sp. ctBtT5]
MKNRRRTSRIGKGKESNSNICNHMSLIISTR